MNPLFAGILLCTLLGAALGNRMRCYDCGGGPSGLCKETVTTCGEDERCGFLERKPQPDLAQTKLPGNPMTLVLQLLPLLLLSRALGDPGASLNGHPGDRVNLSCIGVSQPTRWVWAPRFPACKGLSKGRRPILWASPSGTPTVPPAQPFAGRINALDLGIRRLELLLSAGDSGTFICKGRQEEESRTELHVLGDRAYCKALGSSYSQILIPLLGAGLVLGLGVLGWACWRRRRSPPHPPEPTPRFALSPPHSSTRESRAPEARRGGRAQDARGPGSGAEPALRRPGSYGPQKFQPTVPSGPC